MMYAYLNLRLSATFACQLLTLSLPKLALEPVGAPQSDA